MAPPRLPPWFLHLARAAMGGLLFVAAAETAVRFGRPTPRAQIVRAWEAGPFQVVDGQPLWRPDEVAAREMAALCDPGGVEVALVGSSIFDGLPIPHRRGVQGRLLAELQARGGAWCVRNHARGAYTGAQQLALAPGVLDTFDPALVVWEVWESNPDGFTLLGGDAYNLGALRRDGLGFPDPVPPLPDGLNRALFLHSRAWEYLALAVTRQEALDGGAFRRYADGLRALVPRVRDRGGEIVFVLMPPLGVPFAQTAEAQRRPDHVYAPVVGVAEDLGVRVVRPAEAWLDRDPADLRVDLCCHLNEAGHQALAELLVPVVEELAGAAAR